MSKASHLIPNSEWPEAKNNLSFYQDTPKVLTMLVWAELPAFGAVILQYT